MSTQPRSRIGRPAIMSREALLDRIREIAGEGHGLFRVHREHPEIYARARRRFGTWEEAVRRAGVDYDAAVRTARDRSREPLRRPRSVTPPSHGGNNLDTPR